MPWIDVKCEDGNHCQSHIYAVIFHEGGVLVNLATISCKKLKTAFEFMTLPKPIKFSAFCIDCLNVPEIIPRNRIREPTIKPF